MGFLPGFFDRLGDIADGISGKTDSKNLQAQLENQQELNEKILELQKQEIAYRESPEYLAARQKQIYIACVVLIAALIGAVFLLKKAKN